MRPLTSGESIGNGAALDFVAFAVVQPAACQGIPTQAERQAPADVASACDVCRPLHQRPSPGPLHSNAGLGDLLQCALLNEPNNVAAYFGWAASVRGVTQARSLPDPRLTLQRDIADMVTSRDVLRTQIEQERSTTDISNLGDSRNPLPGLFEAAPGLKAADAVPTVSQACESAPPAVAPVLPPGTHPPAEERKP